MGCRLFVLCLWSPLESPLQRTRFITKTIGNSANIHKEENISIQFFCSLDAHIHQNSEINRKIFINHKAKHDTQTVKYFRSTVNDRIFPTYFWNCGLTELINIGVTDYIPISSTRVEWWLQPKTLKTPCGWTEVLSTHQL